MKNKQSIKKFLAEAIGTSVWSARLDGQEAGYVVGASEEEAMSNASQRWGSNAEYMSFTQLSPSQLKMRKKSLEQEKSKLTLRLATVEKELSLMAALG